MAKTFKTPESIIGQTAFCPGCGHGVINRLVVEVLEELEVEDKSICSLAVGCACLMTRSFGIDMIQAQHGRAPAVATGIKRSRPESVVFTYQGDGDLSAIGAAEILHVAGRNENITVIFVNNGVFGMTGGQMAPTTLPEQRTVSSPRGRDTDKTGMPFKMTEVLSVFDIAYSARGSVASVADINKTKKYIRNAFEAQLNNEGFAIVEILSQCPTNWKLTPLDSSEKVKNQTEKFYPLGEMIKRGGKE